MFNIALVFFGGGVGSIFRYLVYLFTSHFFIDRFFLGTFLVNIVGSFLIGVFYFLASDSVKMISDSAKLLLITGFLGGFTTFSAFSLEFLKLIETGQILIAGLYVLFSVAISLALVFAGFYLTKYLV
jgi:CrcB protein